MSYKSLENKYLDLYGRIFDKFCFLAVLGGEDLWGRLWIT